MATKPLAIARNWAEHGRLARIPFGRPFIGAQRNRFRFDAGLAERIPLERVDLLTARVGDRRPSWKRLRKVLESRLRLELRRTHLVNKFRFDPGGLIAPIQHISRRIRA
jgi:hypothetical protein